MVRGTRTRCGPGCSTIDEAHDELHDSDPDQARQKAELEAERRAIGKRLMSRAARPPHRPRCATWACCPTTRSSTPRPPSTPPCTGRGRRGPDDRSRSRPDPYSYDRPARLRPVRTGTRQHLLRQRLQARDHRPGDRHRPAGRNGEPGASAPAAATSAPRTPPRTAHACPRCKTARIADDGSCLFQVVEPATVTSRDKREDARIRDDKRRARPALLHRGGRGGHPARATSSPGSWRHRHADVRRRLLPPRHDPARSTSDRVRYRRPGPRRLRRAARAAQPLPRLHRLRRRQRRRPARLRPRHRRGGLPRPPAAGSSSTTARGARCGAGKKTTRRRNRCCSPTSCRPKPCGCCCRPPPSHVEAKVHSFRAALRLGVDLHFGGDPQHLATTVASMPDNDSGERRWFLVLFDRLPGGTGYLDRLTKPDAFRDTLAAAYEALGCPCARGAAPGLPPLPAPLHPGALPGHRLPPGGADMLGSAARSPRTERTAGTSTDVDHTGLVGLDAPGRVRP